MATHIERRKFLATLAAAVALPLAARAQQQERMRRVGVLQGLAESDPEARARTAAFRQELEALGWTEGTQYPDRLSICRRQCRPCPGLHGGAGELGAGPDRCS